MRPRGFAALVLVGVMAVTSECASAAKAPRWNLRVQAPAPGEATVVIVSQPGRNAAQARRAGVFSARRAATWPASIRVITLTRARRVKGRWRRVGLAIVVNRKGMSPRQRPVDQEEQDFEDRTLASLVLVFTGVDISEDPLFNRKVREKQAWAAWLANARAAAESKQAAEAELAKLAKREFGDFKASDVDTGHYDDGHAFGWGFKDDKGAWKRLYTDIANEHLDRLIADLEAAANADLDADGAIGAPSTTGCTGSATLDATLTLPDGADYQDFSFPSAIPAGCDLGTRAGGSGARDWSAVVHDAADPSTIYFCHQAVGPPPGESPCTSAQPAFPDGGDITQDVVLTNAGYAITFRWNGRTPGTVKVDVHYAWRASG